MNRLWYVVAVAGVAGSASAADLIKDLRAPGSRSSLTVAICARPGVPGHAMVVLGREDAAKQACTVEAFGFYPDGAKAAVLGNVPGALADEFLRGKGVASAACRVVVKVDPAGFERVAKVRKRWGDRTNYKLLEADCVTFTGEVAAALGLKVPDRKDAKLPTTFVEKLYDLNR